jgi:hypothetical protein
VSATSCSRVTRSPEGLTPRLAVGRLRFVRCGPLRVAPHKALLVIVTSAQCWDGAAFPAVELAYRAGSVARICTRWEGPRWGDHGRV